MSDEQISEASLRVKEKILQFLKRNELAVISTIHTDRNCPESAVVGFANNDSLELIFGTSNKTRKYTNLQKNSNVSFVIGFSSESGSVQYEGEASEVSPDEMTGYADLLIQRNENNRINIAKEDYRLFVVKPTWIRFLDTSKDSPGKYEISF